MRSEVKIIICAISWGFVFSGLLLVIFGLLSMKESKENIEKAVAVQAEIVKIDKYKEKEHLANDYYTTKYDVYITYTFDNQLYENIPLNNYYPSMKVGDKIQILCNPNNPRSIGLPQTVGLFGWILISMGLFFIVAGAIVGTKLTMNIIKNIELKSNGIKICATITSIDIDQFFVMDNSTPYIITCTDGINLYKSETIWADIPSIYQIGDDIDVIVDPDDYTKYYVKYQDQ